MVSSQMKVTDEIRINILEALLKTGSVQPNLRQVQRRTGYHKATIKSSMDFLQKEGILHGFGPKINYRKLGYDIEVLSINKVDLSEEKAFAKYLATIEKDDHVYWVGSVVGSGNWNILTRNLYKSVEKYHESFQKRYRSIPGFYDLVTDTQSFFSVEPIFKHTSRTKSIIELIKRERGAANKD
jgi:DNA-binding Lrp family transcriptional regulator